MSITLHFAQHQRPLPMVHQHRCLLQAVSPLAIPSPADRWTLRVVYPPKCSGRLDCFSMSGRSFFCRDYRQIPSSPLAHAQFALVVPSQIHTLHSNPHHLLNQLYGRQPLRSTLPTVILMILDRCAPRSAIISGFTATRIEHYPSECF
jgi:hypothetical protein